MNEVIENIKKRRSIKKYKSDMVPQELIDIITEAGTYAPSGLNKQSPIIIEVTNKDMRDRLSRLNAKVAGMPEGLILFIMLLLYWLYLQIRAFLHIFMMVVW